MSSSNFLPVERMRAFISFTLASFSSSAFMLDSSWNFNLSSKSLAAAWALSSSQLILLQSIKQIKRGGVPAPEWKMNPFRKADSQYLPDFVVLLHKLRGLTFFQNVYDEVRFCLFFKIYILYFCVKISSIGRILLRRLGDNSNQFYRFKKICLKQRKKTLKEFFSP